MVKLFLYGLFISIMIAGFWIGITQEVTIRSVGLSIGIGFFLAAGVTNGEK